MMQQYTKVTIHAVNMFYIKASPNHFVCLFEGIGIQSEKGIQKTSEG